MTLYYHYQPQYRQLCPEARTLAEVGNQIFAKIADHPITPEQLQQLQQSLILLCQELEANLSLFHYGSSHGLLHTCVRDIYTEAAFRLNNIAILQAAPPPPEAPEETKPPLTHEDVENIFHSLPPDTYFGTERDEDDSA
jgi:hypothetical protein